MKLQNLILIGALVASTNVQAAVGTFRTYLSWASVQQYASPNTGLKEEAHHYFEFTNGDDATEEHDLLCWDGYEGNYNKRGAIWWREWDRYWDWDNIGSSSACDLTEWMQDTDDEIYSSLKTVYRGIGSQYDNYLGVRIKSGTTVNNPATGSPCSGTESWAAFSKLYFTKTTSGTADVRIILKIKFRDSTVPWEPYNNLANMEWADDIAGRIKIGGSVATYYWNTQTWEQVFADVAWGQTFDVSVTRSSSADYDDADGNWFLQIVDKDSELY